MEQKHFHLLSCSFLIFLLNPFPAFTREHSPHQHNTEHPSSPLDFLDNLIGAQKGNSAGGLEGLSQLKRYLSSLGYMNNINNTKQAQELINDLFDDNLELAIKHYQGFFKLTKNGILDADTVAKMKQPRCGVPDHFSNHKEGRFQDLIPIIASRYTFFPGPKWPPTKRIISCSFPLGTRTDLNKAILDATTLWASVSPFKFTYTPNYDEADIKISFQYGEHGDWESFDGPGGILAHASAPIDGYIHYDGDERWVDGAEPGAIDLRTVGLHELGHILGLGHSPDTRAIMYPIVPYGFRRPYFGRDDIDGIRALYPF